MQRSDLLVGQKDQHETCTQLIMLVKIIC